MAQRERQDQRWGNSQYEKPRFYSKGSHSTPKFDQDKKRRAEEEQPKKAQYVSLDSIRNESSSMLQQRFEEYPQEHLEYFMEDSIVDAYRQYWAYTYGDVYVDSR
jgi:hypothetical protein